jgi:hypothetical protein
MNCHNIARIIDSGEFSAVSDSDRRDAEEHALSCRHCARLWIPHSRLAVSPVPEMPPDLARHCQALVAAAAKGSVSHRAPRMVIVVTSLIALAAAASMLGVGLSSRLAPHQDAPLPSFSVPPVSPVPGESGGPSGAAGQALPTVTQAQAASSTSGDLPLFPPPYAAEQAAGARLDMALEKFAELHPEVTEVPPAGTLYAGSIVVRDDGNVLDHSFRITTAGAFRQSTEPHRGLPNDGREPFGNYRPKGLQLANGRALGADLLLDTVVVRNDYDPARSSLRVEQIIRTQRARLMAPPDATGGSHLTILLSAAGEIRREVAGHIDRDALQQQEEWSAIKRAEWMASVLGISKEEIGMMGSVTVVEEGTNRGVVVDYAWQRLPGESTPQYRQAGWDQDRHGQEGVDTAAAVQVIERVMPDAFMGGEEVGRELGIPTILLTEKGEFIRTGRTGGSSSDPRKTFPGVHIATFRMLVLKNGKGATCAVYFLWQ